MAILTQAQYLAAIQTIVGDAHDDAALKFLEDMTDTYNSLSQPDAEDWKGKYEALDNEWRERYRKRFFDGPPQPQQIAAPAVPEAAPSAPQPDTTVSTDTAQAAPDAETIGIDDLFSPAEAGA